MRCCPSNGRTHLFRASAFVFVLATIGVNVRAWFHAPLTILAPAATASLIATAKAEEVELSQKFGSAYAEYRKSTKMFIPYVF